MLETILQDLRYAARQLWGSPNFTIPAVLVLGLGIGGTAAMYSVLHAVVLQPLPFHQPDRLARLYHLSEEWSRVPSSPSHFRAFLEQAESIEGLVGYGDYSANVAGPAGPEHLRGAFILGPVFDLLGTQPAIGRGPTLDDLDPASPEVVVLSHGASQRLLDPTKDPLGQSVRINGKTQTVVGIAPPGFDFPHREVDFWSPAQGIEMDSLGSVLSVIVRLAPGVPIDQATTELSLISRRLQEANPETELGDVILMPLRDSVVQSVKTPLLLLMGAVGLVLLVACANVANLLLARAAGRRREMAVRRALGAARHRLVRQLLTESLLLAAISTAVGLAFATLGLQTLLSLFSDQLPRSENIALDGGVLAFILGISLISTLLFGVLPSLSLSRTRRRNGSIDLTRGSQARRGEAPQFLLAVAQTGLAVMLLVGAGLLLRSLGETLAVDPGFRAENGFSFSVLLPWAGYDDEASALRFHDQLQERFGNLPGVGAVARTSFLPLNQRTGWASEVQVKGRPDDEGIFLYRVVSPNYFPVIGARRVEGRLFSDVDRNVGATVVVINESMARELWPDGDALGAVLTLGSPKDPLIAEATVVGVVEDARDLELAKAPRPVLYAPHHLISWFGRFEYVMRTPLEPASLLAGLRREVEALDANVPITRVRTLQSLISDDVADSRASATLASVFALLALALAAAGLFSLSAYRVAQRSQELAIRISLGATTANIRRLVLRQGLAQATAGLIVGLIGALLLTRLLQSLLVGITPQDPLTLAATALLLLITMTIACLPIARRAAKIAPLEMLRDE